MMLPEHKEQIISHYYEKKKAIKPILDEARLEEFDEVIHTALEFHSLVCVTYWVNGFNRK
ncbi:YolD-like family protein [Bacillus sp. FJAT-49732]|uniref:YolD-like family protein n=1 Tax=Lederbergia citrisecunda TaxID=2833583 RepID=A0A942YJZ6_9BACI|nr:YolD-like family protein [Lederbergia citrisecunda]MBS4199127.1 YolD-like family protein [Lederbergia citrisecunda]